MYSSFDQIIDEIRRKEKVTVAVAVPNDEHVLHAVCDANKEKIADFILVGDRVKIRNCLREYNINDEALEIEHVEGDLAEQCDRAVKLVVENKANVLMKGMVDTSIFLKSILNEEKLRSGRIMSIATLLQMENYHKLLIITDLGMCIKPNLNEKKQIIENSIVLANALGITEPKVAVLCAVEKVNDKMPETVDAQKLLQMNLDGIIPGCIISGPLAMDNIISKKAAKIKGINSPVAGDADIILAPDIVSANSLGKSLIFLADAKSAGILLGANVPVVITSRADSREAKLHSIAMSVIMAKC